MLASKFITKRSLVISATAAIRIVPQPVRMFAAAPTDKEKEQARAEWGIKYDDECLKFEKEWK